MTNSICLSWRAARLNVCSRHAPRAALLRYTFIYLLRYALPLRTHRPSNTLPFMVRCDAPRSKACSLPRENPPPFLDKGKAAKHKSQYTRTNAPIVLAHLSAWLLLPHYLCHSLSAGSFAPPSVRLHIEQTLYTAGTRKGRPAPLWVENQNRLR